MVRTDRERVTPVTNLQEFFLESVTQSMRRQGVSADDSTAHYVVSLLTLFSRSEALYDEIESRPALKPLALMLVDAVEAASPGERAFALQRLGDVSLFVAGFFADSLADKIVDIDYYISMGGGAYRSLSLEIERTPRGSAFGPVFGELSAKFKDFVDVLADIRADARGTAERDVLRLYDLWLRTGSARAERLLRRLGIEPNATLNGRARH
jgi:hypothetical protein